MRDTTGRSSHLLVAVLLCALVFASGCGRRSDEVAPFVLDESKPIAAVIGEVREELGQASREARRLAPELVAAAETYAKWAETAASPEEQKELVRSAAQAYRDAEAVAGFLGTDRQLQFPTAVSIGKVSFSRDGGNWIEHGSAQGNIDVPADTSVMVQLVGPDFSDGLRQLASMPPGAVQYVSLFTGEFTREGLEHLTSIVGMRQLSLYDSNCDDESLLLISRCRGLQQLNLMATAVTDEGMRALARLPVLKELAIGDTEVSDRGVYTISRFPALETLYLRDNPITDVSVDYLRAAPHLQRLWLGGRRITDNTVPLLSSMTQLKELNLLHTHVTERAVRALERALPECKLDTVS